MMHLRAFTRTKASSEDQKEFWEIRRTRRAPTHPVIEAFARPKVDFLVKELAPKADTSLLDVGAGNGFYSQYLIEHFSVSCSDFARQMLKNNSCMTRVQARAEALPFNDGSFDVVFCASLLHHLPDPQDAIEEMARVARKFVVLCEPNRANPLLAAFMLLRAEERHGLKFSLSHLEGMARAAGLNICRSTTMGGILPNRVPALLLPLFCHLERPHKLATTHIVIALKPQLV
jgi:SAM-dependent methyltransferase